MDMLVLSFGDSYDRYSVGVATSLDSARAMARDYLARHHFGGVLLRHEYFSVARFAVDRVYDLDGGEDAVLDLD
jgi:hypothetical protein